SEDTAPTSRDFAVWAATEWVHHVRQGDRSAQTCARVRELLDCCTSDSTRAFLAASLYSVVPRRLGIGPMSAEEHGLLRSLKPLFMSQGRGPAFIAALAGTLPHDWENLKPLLEQSLLELPPSELPAGIASLIDAIFWVVRDTNDVQSLPSGLNLWLLDQLMRAPDPTDLSDLDWHNMNKILDRLGRAPLTWLPGALKTRVAMEEAGTARLAISGDTRYPISHFVKPITASDRENLETRAVLKDLLGWLPNRGSVGYYLPQLLGDVDPDGILVPDLVASALQSSLSADEQQRLARIASRYPLGSLPWRAIAKPALNAVRRRSQEDRFRLYSALSEKGVVEWQSAIGEVPTLFRSAVEEAVRRRDEEQDADFRDFWDWMVDGAQAELRWHEERAQMETIA
ncbi:MAG TPA: hypothetical protein PKY30_08980, partial [Myxococcota bacterium]|nr:hypothetical protein [Myxococcota bacterium]